jgi:hypothetical protein
MSPKKRALVFTLLIIFILSIIAFLSISYTATMYFLAGVFMALVLIVAIPPILILKEKVSLLTVTVVIMIIAIGIIISQSLLGYRYTNLSLTGCIKPGDTILETILTEYHAFIEPIDVTQGLFGVSEEARYNIKGHTCMEDFKTSSSIIEEDKVLSLPKKEVYSLSRGLFIRELKIKPLDGSDFNGSDCCPETITVELLDFPRDSFYEGRDVIKAESSRYLDTETVVLENRSLNREIVFAYIKPPFNLLRTFLTPIITLSYQSNWMIILFGLIGGFIITNVVKPTLTDMAKARFKAYLEKSISKRNEKSTDDGGSTIGDEEGKINHHPAEDG